MSNTSAQTAKSSPLSSRTAWGLAFALALTVGVYWPSLFGGFVFDDYVNILTNREIRITALDFESLRQAAKASPSPTLLRPLAMLSFGLDYYFSGGIFPLRMKLVNLAIHLLNGLLLFGLLRALLRSPRVAHARADLLALCVTAAWLLAPINFTGVAYVVQRMESLCHTFVLAGLWGYVGARKSMLQDRGGMVRAMISVVLGTTLGGLSKESAALLPLYALIAEWCLFDFRQADGRRDRRVLILYALLLGLPAIVASAYLLPRLLAPEAFAFRPFTLTERLLTEARVLMHYLHWTLLPQPRLLSMYHDNIVLSRGLLSPATTLASILALLGLAVAAMALRRRLPLFALGALWFLAAHLLTATIIPLELVFEHRNYFASAGVLLVVFAAILPAGQSPRMPRARLAGCLALLLLYACTSFARSLEWQHPLNFAMAEVQKNPDSPRAVYELGSTYALLSNYKADSPLLNLAIDTLERAATLPHADALGDEGRIFVESRSGRATPARVWQRMQQKLQHNPLTASDTTALNQMADCAIAGDCKLPPEDVIATFVAALSHQPPDAKVLGSYANYAFNVLRDNELALQLTRDAIVQAPKDPNLRRNLLFLLLADNRMDEARRAYAEIRPLFPEVDKNPDFAKLGANPVQ